MDFEFSPRTEVLRRQLLEFMERYIVPAMPRYASELAAGSRHPPVVEELKQVLGRARAKRGMFEGDLEEGELEIGQVSGMIRDIAPAATVLHRLIAEFEAARARVSMPRPMVQ